MNIYLIGIAAGVCGLVVGYIVARLDGIYMLLRAGEAPSLTMEYRAKPASKRAEPATDLRKISIDTGTVVTDIKTDGMSKTNAVAIGKETVLEDNLNQSVSKLAQLKR